MNVKNYQKKIIDILDIQGFAETIKRQGLEIVTTNGCFDILHLGHIEYLQSASKLGDIMIVGINSDSSVKKLKGSKRPVNNEKSRCAVIASLGFVDYCILFSEDTPVKLLEKIKPDIHVKGGDYKPENILEKDTVEKYGGIVKILPLVDGYSTTEILKKI